LFVDERNTGELPKLTIGQSMAARPR